MRIISNLIDNRKVWRALRDYPVYSPPFHDAEVVPTREEIKANYDYFLQQKALRVEYLTKYLAMFSLELRFTREALLVLDQWLYRYGGQLIPSGGEKIDALASYDPAWVGAYHGLNIVSDVSIFAGDYVISRNKEARWDVWYGDGGKYDYEEEGFGQPCLYGLRLPWLDKHFSMLRETYRCCNAGYARLMRGESLADPWNDPGEFLRRLDQLSNQNPR